MALVIGRGQKFYDVPEEVLEKYQVSAGKVENLKQKVKKLPGKQDDAEVEGYGYYYGSTYEGYGWYCDWWDAWSEQ